VIREGGVTLLRWQRKRGEKDLVVPANLDGKIKMYLQSAGIVAALMPIPWAGWPIVIWVPLIASIPYSLRSGRAYLQAR